MHVFIASRFGVDFIGVAQDLPDSSYTSSPIWDSSGGTFYAHYARLDGEVLMWKATPVTEFPWIQIDMLNVYTIIGLMMVKPVELYANVFDLKVSMDGVNYQYVGQSITMNYLVNEDYTTYWFEHATDARYWRFEPVDYTGSKPAFKGDVIGYIGN